MLRRSDSIISTIRQHSLSITGFRRQPTILREIYFCNICFTNYPISEGFTLRACSHQFCIECIKQFISDKINNGQLNIHCFRPSQLDETACGQIIDEEDLHQIISTESWDKYLRFKSNKNRLSRQCPFCNHTQIGSDDVAMMRCEKAGCGQLYCSYHSNAHPADTSCQEYEFRNSREMRMNEMAIMNDENVKSCPECNFRIFKNGGCNHMKCVSCNCSFCWLCLDIIENVTKPKHFQKGNCAGQQFDILVPVVNESTESAEYGLIDCICDWIELRGGLPSAILTILFLILLSPLFIFVYALKCCCDCMECCLG